ADGTVRELPRFEPPGCGPDRSPMPAGITVEDDGVVSVADPGCDALYRIVNAETEFIAGVEDFDTNEQRGPDCPDVTDTGFFPTLVTAEGGRLLVAIESCTTV